MKSVKMQSKKGWLPREGFNADVVGGFLKQTIFNPMLTLPLLLLTQYTSKGQDLTGNHATAVKRLRFLVYLGVARFVNRYLNHRTLNNAVKDTYAWEREVAVVTGGSDGIGKEVVLLLAQKGLRVAVMDVQPLTFEATSNITYHQCDIRSTKAIAEAASQIRAIHGEPTVLILNAGVARGKTILDASEAEIRLTFEVNALAHYWLAKEFLPSMTKANHGMVVTVASLAAYCTAPNMVDYASTKAAALSFHEGLAAELKTRYNAPKVRTVVVTQGFTRTPLFKGYDNRDDFLTPTLHPQTVAEGIVNKVLTGESGHVTLPGSAILIPLNLRSFPHWFQTGVRNECEKVMKNWQGRQVIDPEEQKEEKQAVAPL